MKNKILILIIGILIGAIITTSGFLIYNKAVVKNPKDQETMRRDRNGGTPPEKTLNSNNNNNV